jgi:hypothetical protein
VPADTLPVHLNRESLHALEVPDGFETTDSFDVALINHGASVHVHLHLDDDLSEAATIDASNHFIDGDSRRAVRIDVDGTRPVTGKLKVASGYGAETRYVDVRVVEPEETEDHVEVGESLTEPQPRQPSDVESDDGSLGDVVAGNPEMIVLVLGFVAIVVAALAALVLDEVVVMLGALAVLAGVLGALYVLTTGS